MKSNTKFFRPHPCAIRQTITRSSSSCVCSPAPCWKWDCSECAEYGRHLLTEKLVLETERGDLHLVETSDADSSRMRKAIEGRGYSFVIGVNGDGKRQFIIDGAVDGSRPFPGDDTPVRRAIAELVGGWTGKAGPVSFTASRDWKLYRSLGPYIVHLELETHLPISQIMEIAVELGGIPVTDTTWRLSSGLDGVEWDMTFVERITDINQQARNRELAWYRTRGVKQAQLVGYGDRARYLEDVENGNNPHLASWLERHGG